ncbi:hypothetical protein EJB05_17490 [Eragrostis curvula]|uniref:Uncharacterized protein n=1 Tax=Eragrostis curvula TaxID=38414 RepID=A0A5J9VGZ2_9POAL|nr:hypothetical protein EJB05_17490 [Eragrostis curvula]
MLCPRLLARRVSDSESLKCSSETWKKWPTGHISFNAISSLQKKLLIGVPITEPERCGCQLRGEQLVLHRQGEECQRLDLELFHEAGGDAVVDDLEEAQP